MKILLSAYACEPYKGSEPAVGWNWLMHLANTNNEIWLLTRKNNCSVIDEFFEKNSKPNNVHFIYHDLPDNLMFIKKTFGIYIYYLLWQIGAFFTARQKHKKFMFDQVHHVTFATIRQPSFMGLLNIPFVYGPVGGGESPPYHLIKNFPWQAKRKEIIRILANYWVKLDPFMHFTFFTADKIVVTSTQTSALVSRLYKNKVDIKLAIAQSNSIAIKEKKPINQNDIKLLFVGRFEYWKGLHLCIQALTILKHIAPEKKITLTIVGEGSYKNQFVKLATMLGVDSLIKWHSWMAQEQLDEIYASHDVFVFPSLHDSGGMVVLEALAASMPTICLNLGGPSTIVTNASGIIIDANLPEKTIVSEVAESILKITEEDNYPLYVLGARARSQELTWEKLIAELL